MHSKFIRLALFSGSLLLVVHSAIAQITPAPVTPPPIIDPGTIIGPGPTATPTTPPVSPAPTPTIPAVSPPPTNPPAVLERASPQAATVVIRYGPANTLILRPFNDWGRFQKVALQPNQVVTVIMALSLPDFGRPADVQILDGGAIAATLAEPLALNTNPTEPEPTPPPEMTPIPVPDLDGLIDAGQTIPVSATGELAFRFRPGRDVGLHRVSVIVGGNQYFLQFWRQDMSAPSNNPRMLRAY